MLNMINNEFETNNYASWLEEDDKEDKEEKIVPKLDAFRRNPIVKPLKKWGQSQTNKHMTPPR